MHSSRNGHQRYLERITAEHSNLGNCSRDKTLPLHGSRLLRHDLLGAWGFPRLTLRCLALLEPLQESLECLLIRHLVAASPHALLLSGRGKDKFETNAIRT
jgi:hypothetical protein